MSLAIKVYEVSKNDERKARILSEVIDEVEEKLIPVADTPTKENVEIAKLELQKDIEEVRFTLKRYKKVSLSLEKEIEKLRPNLIKWF